MTINMLNQFNEVMLRHGIGVDSRFFKLGATENGGFPPHNIEKLVEDTSSGAPVETRYRLTLAVAGFSKEDISISILDDLLTVSGSHDAPIADPYDNSPWWETLYRGIGMRNFTRSFKIGEHVSVEKASLDNGLLRIDLVQAIPDVLKPRQIALS